MANAEQEGGQQPGVAYREGGHGHGGQRTFRRRALLQCQNQEEEEEARRQEDPVGVEQRATRRVGDGVVHQQRPDRGRGHAGRPEGLHALLRGDVEELPRPQRADQRHERGKRPAAEPDEADGHRDGDGGKGDAFDEIGVHRHAQLLTRPKRRSRP